MKKEIQLSRIHCVGCAVNLEDKVREVEGVKSAVVDFAAKKVIVEADGKEIKEVVKRVEKCITKFDSSIRIVDTSQREKAEKREKFQKWFGLAKIIFAGVLTLVGYLLPAKIEWLKITLYMLAYVSVGLDVLYAAAKNIIHGKMLDENFLMSVATIGALCLQQWIEAIAVMFLYSIGEFFQELAVGRSRKRVQSLLKIKAECANKVVDGGEEVVSLDSLKVGDIIRIKAGEKVPLDCKVLEGQSYLNMAAITGESREVFVKQGDELLSGCINGEGVLLASITKTEKDSTVTKIVEMVENATKTKAKTEKFITKFAKWYTPIVVGVAVLLAVVPWLCGQAFSVWLYRALTFLVVSCPCALIISIPLGYFAGIGAEAHNGVLIKGSTYLEMLAKVSTVAFDKTGTLTEGNFVVDKVFAKKGTTQKEVLELVAYAESFSNHRIAKSIVAAFEKPINTAFVEDYTERAGLGVEVTLFGELCVVGKAELLKEHEIKFEEAEEVGTVVYLAKSGKYMGYVRVSDKIKEDSFSVVEKLKACGVKTVTMFTGDNEDVANSVANELNLDAYYAGLLPEGKVESLKEIKKEGTMAFVGDGINDAPVLASVDVGISMGGVGSDVAIEASDVVIMTDQPSKVADAIKIAKKTRKVIYENVIGILLVKVAVLILSAFGLSGMWLAIFADVGLSLLAVLNSLRAMIYKDKKKGKKSTSK